MTPLFRRGLFALLFLFCWSSTASAILFERRKTFESELSWFVYPVVGSIPGVQDFYGLGGTVSGIGGSESDITAISLRGKAEYFDDDFQIDIFSIFDIPLFTNHLTFTWFSTKIRNAGWPEGERGIDSDPDSMYYLLASNVDASGGELSVNVLENQLEFYYAYSDASVKPYGLVDPNGTFYNTQNAGIIESPRGYRFGLYLDDTDNRRDPRIGYRFQYEKWGQPSTRSGNSEYFQEDYNLSGYIPVLAEGKGVLVLNQFFGSSTVIKKGTIDQSQFVCDNVLKPGCQAILDELYARQVAEAENGKATSLGGTNRLRGYSTNRFYDSYTNFRGAEFRWYVHEVQEAFNFILEKGTFAGLQLAFFYEQGTVSPDKASLWKNMRSSYGAGTRFIFNTIIVRIDRGFGKEGGETTFFVGYPF
ncbi:MAG: BamA/TamA family outer membrane protein [Proteobacteria bacterium]|nr:BamA/TamA family outer membrane protein [Pseudomonadota bacterium]